MELQYTIGVSIYDYLIIDDKKKFVTAIDESHYDYILRQDIDQYEFWLCVYGYLPLDDKKKLVKILGDYTFCQIMKHDILEHRYKFDGYIYSN